MYKNKKILAIIPARGGSKGILKKNIIDVGGRPLIYYSIDCLDSSKYIDKAIISTNDLEIKKVAENYIDRYGKNVEIPFLRPDELSKDNSKTIDCIIHAINWLKTNKNEEYDYVLLAQNTSPLRKGRHIDEAIVKLIDSNQDSLVSVTKVKQHPILMRSINEDGTVKNLLNINSTIRRQDFPDFYKVDGAIYIQKITENFNSDVSFNDGKLAYIMEEKYSVDIDDYIDLKIVNHYLEKEKEEEMKFMK